MSIYACSKFIFSCSWRYLKLYYHRKCVLTSRQKEIEKKNYQVINEEKPQFWNRERRVMPYQKQEKMVCVNTCQHNTLLDQMQELEGLDRKRQHEPHHDLNHQLHIIGSDVSKNKYKVNFYNFKMEKKKRQTILQNLKNQCLITRHTCLV